MREEQFKFIESYPGELDAVNWQVRKYFHNGSIVSDNGVLKVLHRPWVAPENWGLMIWPGADSELVYEAEQTLGRALPGFYKQFLLNINGCFFYDVSMFGLNRYFTRSVLQCHSLLTANQEWIREYNIDQSLFFFGEGSYSESENTGYFYGRNRFYAL